MSNSPDRPEPVQDGHVRLILTPNQQIYLDIPLHIVTPLCLKPRKYLSFLGWCILGVEGELERHIDDQSTDDIESTSNNSDPDGISNRDVYHYHVQDFSTYSSLTSSWPQVHPSNWKTLCSTKDLSHAIDPDVVKTRSRLTSDNSSLPPQFKDQLIKRDACCVFTGVENDSGQTSALHLIPRARGSEVNWAVTLVWYKVLMIWRSSATSVAEKDHRESFSIWR